MLNPNSYIMIKSITSAGVLGIHGMGKKAKALSFMAFFFITNSVSSLAQGTPSGIQTQEIMNFFDWAKPLFNVLIAGAALYYLFQLVPKIFQGDSGATRNVIGIVVGLVVWFWVVPQVIDWIATNGVLGAS
jgi:hypothetical protein